MTDRVIEPEAWEQMLAEAKEFGFGRYTFGSHRMGGDKPGRMTVHFNTLVPAAYYAKDDALAVSPVLFTRNAEGDILLPGRWWQELVAWPPFADIMGKDAIRIITQDVAGRDMVDAIVPRIVAPGCFGADDGLLVSLPDLSGREVVQETLLPGTEAFVPFPEEWLRQLRAAGIA